MVGGFCICVYRCRREGPQKAWKAQFAMEETRERNSKGKAKMKMNAFIAGKENILKKRNANLTKCRPHKISQHSCRSFNTA